MKTTLLKSGRGETMATRQQLITEIARELRTIDLNRFSLGLDELLSGKPRLGRLYDELTDKARKSLNRAIQCEIKRRRQL